LLAETKKPSKHRALTAIRVHGFIESMKKTKQVARKLRLTREAIRALDVTAVKVDGGKMCSQAHTGCGSCCDMGSCVTQEF
jgi:hypothetical protein